MHVHNLHVHAYACKYMYMHMHTGYIHACTCTYNIMYMQQHVVARTVIQSQARMIDIT